MRDPQFRQQQVDGLRAPHVAPVNAPVDELINSVGRGWVPYVARDSSKSRVLFSQVKDL
jgi:hypothetical protein